MRSSGDIGYIQLSIKHSDCLEYGTEEEYEKMAVEEEAFLDLIDSKDWYLMEKEGRTPLLCPIFHGNNEITWQIDLEEPSKN